MELIGKYRNEIILAGVLFCLYLFTRMSVLANLPIFTDEAIYIRWAQIGLHDANWRFISLTDGKGVFFIWVMYPFLKLIPNPLVAGRMVSVTTGLFSLIGMWLLSWELFNNKRVAFLTSVLYIFFPFAVVYDRMALYDSMVAMFAVWSLYFSIWLVRKVQVSFTYTLGLTMGAGLLTKSDAWFSAILLPFTLLLFNFKNAGRNPRLIKWVILAVFAIGIAYIMYNLQRLSPLFGVIAEKNTTFVYPFSEWIKNPFAYFWGNFQVLVSWLYQYLTLSYMLLIIVGLFFKNFLREKLLLLIYFGAPFVALALFGKVIFPRFIFFMSLMLLPIAALGLQTIIEVFEKNLVKPQSPFYIRYALRTAVTTCFILYSAFISYQFIFHPKDAQIASADRGQYIENWPAGWGVSDSIAFFQAMSVNRKIFIGTEGTFGLMPESYEIYFYNNPNIVTKGYWPINSQIPNGLVQHAKTMPTYIVFYEPCSSCSNTDEAPVSWPVQRVFQVTQLQTKLTIYQVQPLQNSVGL